MSAIFSFLGGSAFRAIWGEFSRWMTARQEHKYEVQRMRLQSELDIARSNQQMASLRLQSELGIKVAQVQADAADRMADAEAFSAAIKLAAQPTGIGWVDAWNASVRPAVATVCIALWVASLYQRNWAMLAFDLELTASVMGFYFADRMLRRHGK